MNLDNHSFLTWIKTIVMGGGRTTAGEPETSSGFRVDQEIPLGSWVGGDTPISATINSRAVPVKTVNAAGDDTHLVFQVPRDYDENTDILAISFVALSNSGGGATLTVTASRWAVDAANPEAITFSGTTPLTVGAAVTDATRYTYTFTGQELKRGDMINLSLDSGTPSGSGIYYLSGTATYNSTLVSYNEFVDDDASTPLR